jgi:predicted Ser/Thr protein kinase
MGVVYKGYEPSLNRYVAIKVLAESLAHDASVKERFLREARSMAALNDPHIIQIYFIGDDGGQTYFVMEFVDGESLGSLLKREGKLKPEQAAKIVYQTAQGLATAHDKGVIHRDIKPGNLMVTSRGAIKIADFGIALSTQDFSKKLTSTGEFVGTPGYLSPEVCQGKPVDQRSDIFSLGIVLFECLAGRMPFTDESPLGLMLEVVKAEIPDVCSLNAEVDAELSRILAKMVAKDPADRYQSCHELIADLARHPLVAKGGPLGLSPVSARLEPILRAPGASLAVAQAGSTAIPPKDASFGDGLPALRATRDSAVAPTRLARRHRHVFASPWTAAAIVLLAAASAWAFRSHLPFGASAPETPSGGASVDEILRSSATAASDSAPPQASHDTAASPAAAANGATTRTASTARGTAEAVDPALLDALWLNDIPEDLFDEATHGGTGGSPAYADSASFAPAGYAAPVYAGPLPYSPPPAYYSVAPWRFGFGFGIGIGYWAAHVVAPPELVTVPLVTPVRVFRPVASAPSTPAMPVAGPVPYTPPSVPHPVNAAATPGGVGTTPAPASRPLTTVASARTAAPPTSGGAAAQAVAHASPTSANAVAAKTSAPLATAAHPAATSATPVPAGASTISPNANVHRARAAGHAPPASTATPMMNRPLAAGFHAPPAAKPATRVPAKRPPPERPKPHHREH